MTEAEWLNSGDPAPLLRYLSEQGASDRKLRLLACACCRRAWDLLTDPRSRNAVEVAERFADGRASSIELAHARVHAAGAPQGPAISAYWTTNVKAGGPIWHVFAGVAVPNRNVVKYTEAEFAADLAGVSRRQVSLVHEVVGNPFCPRRLDPHCLAWDCGLVRKLAEGIYEDRAFERMPILGDALEDAGCDDLGILDHCRSAADHVRGCWVLDLILGRR